MSEKRFDSSFFSRFFIRYGLMLYLALPLIILGILHPYEGPLYLLVIGCGLLALDVVLSLRLRQRAATVMLVLFVLACCAEALYTLYWNRYHQFVSEVQSITAYRYADNPDYVRFEIRGRIRNWYYDGEVYENVVLTGYEPGGDIRYTRMASESEPLTISRRGAAFTIRLDVDVSSYEWGPPVEEYLYVLRYRTGRETSIKSAVFMNVFRRVRIRWEEPCMVDDCLLAA